MTSKHNRAYSAYAHVYDAFKGDRSANIELLENLIRKHHMTATDLLDLACGTGAIAQGLGPGFIITGVDTSPDMLHLARKKLPVMAVHQADMTNFTLDQKFDVVYCLHNSVNHLLTFEAWQHHAEQSNIIQDPTFTHGDMLTECQVLALGPSPDNER